VSHAFLCDARFWRFLLELDHDLAVEVRNGGCPHCAAVLHSARYPRKPRGISHSVLGDGYEWRWSFCCAREGCRRRCTPPSVRFFNRRVYLGALVVLISALTHGLTPRRREAFREHFGISARTLGRWRRWWRETMPTTPWWRTTQAWFIPPLDRDTLPASLLERFTGPDPASRLLAVLRFLTPLSTACERIR